MAQNKESKFIIDLYANKLYSYAMSKLIPTSGFKWLDPNNFNLNKYIAIFQKYVFAKFILNMLKSCEKYTIVIHQQQVKQK